MDASDLIQRAARAALGQFTIGSAWLKLDRWYVAREHFAHCPSPRAFRDWVPRPRCCAGWG